jgi:hypothetical protein
MVDASGIPAMSNPAPLYERLTRPRAGLNGWGSLWLAKDHLLHVSNTFSLERYRRWYFRDIQGFVLQRTSARLAWNFFTCVIAFASLAVTGGCLYRLSKASGTSEPVLLLIVAGIFGAIGFLSLAGAVVNAVMGPTCTVFVQTPHGLDRISSPNRVAAFERILARLRPLLESAQTGSGGESNSLREIAAALDQPLS